MSENTQENTPAPDMSELRQEIDSIDSEMLRLLNQRVSVAGKIGQTKKSQGLPVFDPAREQRLLKRLAEGCDDTFCTSHLKRIYTEIISACRTVQDDVEIAYLGPEATFTHQAALTHFGGSGSYIAMQTIEDVFEAVARDKADCGIVPVENSTQGTVAITLDCFREYNTGEKYYINGEIYLRISHQLIGQSKKKEDISQVVSHPQGLMQCRLWLQRHLPNIECLAVSSTAAAAEMAKKDPTIAAIGGELLATTYGLEIVASDIQDHIENQTRFLILGKAPAEPSGHDKTSLWFAASHEPGSLFASLQCFADAGVNLSRIESRPLVKRPWEYVFFIDLEGHCKDDHVAEAIINLRKKAASVHLLGSYPGMSAVSQQGLQNP